MVSLNFPNQLQHKLMWVADFVRRASQSSLFPLSARGLGLDSSRRSAYSPAYRASHLPYSLRLAPLGDQELRRRIIVKSPERSADPFVEPTV
jgi:hypothetical protein